MYIGYAPYQNPEISIAVTIENAGGGGSNAAPLAREVMDFYFEKNGYNQIAQSAESTQASAEASVQ